MNNDFQSNCGGKRRGCCIIELPHDEQPDDITADILPKRRLFLVSGLLSGGSSDWTVVSVADSEAADLLGKATR
jgi:hypothetical protein